MDRSKRKNRFQSGFTFIEVVVSLTILAMMLLVIFWAFRLGLSAWERGKVTKEEYQRLRIVSQLLSQQIKSIVPYKIKTQKAEADYLAFEGKGDSLKFVSALPLRTKGPEGFVYAIYRFKRNGGEGGQLVLYEGKVLNKNFIEEEPEEEWAIPLLEGISRITFEYYGEENQETDRKEGWFEEWNAKEERELPRAVRITIKKNEKKGEANPPLILLTSVPAYQYEEVRTVPRRTVPATTTRRTLRGGAQPQGF
jgi:prepilin-type N-terminal cleavage/methylation domain-containing protein